MIKPVATLCKVPSTEVCEQLNEEMYPPGHSIHEVGTARMGDDPRTSALNKWCQAHDIQNLFVMDGSCFVSSGCQNPTLTILALALRSSEYLVNQYKRKEL